MEALDILMQQNRDLKTLIVGLSEKINRILASESASQLPASACDHLHELMLRCQSVIGQSDIAYSFFNAKSVNSQLQELLKEQKEAVQLLDLEISLKTCQYVKNQLDQLSYTHNPPHQLPPPTVQVFHEPEIRIVVTINDPVNKPEDVAGYEVYDKTNRRTYTLVGPNERQLTLQWPKISHGRIYTFRVRAFNGAGRGQKSNKSKAIDLSDFPPPPSISAISSLQLEAELPEVSISDTESSEQLFKEAMERGYVLCRITLCLLIGAAGSGKSHVLNLLLGLLPPEIRRSTSLFELPTRAISLSRAVFAKSTSSNIWKAVSLEELDQMLIGSIKARPSLKPEAFNFTDSTTATVSNSAIDVSVASQPTASIETFEHLSLSDLESELIDLVSKSSGSHKLFEVDWVYLLDSGGQPQFQQLLPAFVKHASAILTVIKLNESLNGCPTVEYYDDEGQSCGKAQVSTLSNEEILMRNFSLLESRHSGVLDKRAPSVFVIGTHKDLENASDQAEARSSKNSRLVNLLRPIFGKRLGYYSLAEEELIFPVNAKEPGPDDHGVAEKLRELVMELSKEEPVKVPLPWWFLDQFLRKLASKQGLKILSVRECEAIARRLSMSPAACHAALVFLSDLKILFYDPKLLPGVVFLTSQVLVGMVTILVHQAHVLAGGKGKKQVSGSGDWLGFRDYGLLTVKLLSCKMFQDHFRPDVFSAHEFLHLLKALNLVAQLNEEEYMMPCLLPDLPRSSAVEYYQSSPSSPALPLLVKYPKRLLPVGIFSIALAFLRNEAGWEVSTELKGKPVLFCCNCAQFNVPSQRRGTVTLLDSIEYLEVHIQSVSPKACSAVCQEIVRDIFQALNRACDILGYGELQPEMAFFCPERGPNCQEAPHPATIADNEWVCSVNNNTGGQLEKQQRVWLHDLATPSHYTPPVQDASYRDSHIPSGTTPNSPLSKLLTQDDLPQLANLLSPAATKWYHLGLQLRVPAGRLNCIEEEHRQTQRKLTQVLVDWLNGPSQTTVDELVRGLRSGSVIEADLALIVEKADFNNYDLV